MNVKLPTWMTLAWAILLVSAPTTAVEANAPAPRATFAFEFVDEASQPVMPDSLQLTHCEDWTCQPIYMAIEMGHCNLPGCAQGVPARVVNSQFECTGNFCHGEVYSWADWDLLQLVLVPKSVDTPNQALVGKVPGPGRELGYNDAVGWRVLVTPDGLVITQDEAVTARAVGPSSAICSTPPSPAMVGFAITQVTELLVVLLLLLLLGIEPGLIGGTLMAVALINFATFPVVWFTFPALGPGPTIQTRAVAFFTLLAALLYAGLLVRLRPAYNPARRSMVAGLLAVALPMVTVLIFAAATTASAAMDAIGAAGAAPSGAGLPYHITMPASEVFAYSAEALLLALLCRPVLSARQAVALSMLANSASLALGLILL